MSTWQILHGDVRERLKDVQPGSVQCVVTSPPYWGLRDYGTATWDGGDVKCAHKQGRDGAGRADGNVDDRGQRNRDGIAALTRKVCQCGAIRVDSQLGLEATPDLFVASMVGVFADVWRVLADDGVCWLNLGDSYAGSWGNQGRTDKRGTQRHIHGPMMQNLGSIVHAEDCDLDDDCSCGGLMRGLYPQRTHTGSWVKDDPTLKPKDLVGIPWRVAFALQAAGWYLRSDIIWSKPNPMPESVTDRPTKAHEYLFLLTKSARYYYNAEAIAEKAIRACEVYRPSETTMSRGQAIAAGRAMSGNALKDVLLVGESRNKRSVWTIATQPYPDAHFATFPEALVEPCILAGSKEGDLILDPFCGSGTAGAVAIRLQRDFVGIELNAAYVELARTRIGNVAPLLAQEIA